MSVISSKYYQLELSFKIKIIAFESDGATTTFYNMNQIPDVELRKSLAFPLFGAFDSFSNYSYFKTSNLLEPFPVTGITTLAQTGKWFLLFNEYFNSTQEIDSLFGSGVPNSTVQFVIDQLKFGDLLFVYQARGTTTIDFYWAAVIISSESVASQSFMNTLNIDTMKIDFFKFNYIASSTKQESVPLSIADQDLLGKNAVDSFTVAAFKKPYNLQDDIINVPYSSILNRYQLWSYAIHEDTTEILFNFYISEIDDVQSLTV